MSVKWQILGRILLLGGWHSTSSKAGVQMGRLGNGGALMVCMLDSRASSHGGGAVEWPSFPPCWNKDELFVPTQAWRLFRPRMQQDCVSIYSGSEIYLWKNLLLGHEVLVTSKYMEVILHKKTQCPKEIGSWLWEAPYPDGGCLQGNGCFSRIISDTHSPQRSWTPQTHILRQEGKEVPWKRANSGKLRYSRHGKCRK